jgi:hypothetical protein
MGNIKPHTEAEHDFHKNVGQLLKREGACTILRLEQFVQYRYANLSKNLTPLRNAKVGNLS